MTASPRTLIGAIAFEHIRILPANKTISALVSAMPCLLIAGVIAGFSFWGLSPSLIISALVGTILRCCLSDSIRGALAAFNLWELMVAAHKSAPVLI